jgi:hypothetical protein
MMDRSATFRARAAFFNTLSSGSSVLTVTAVEESAVGRSAISGGQDGRASLLTINPAQLLASLSVVVVGAVDVGWYVSIFSETTLERGEHCGF